MRPGRPSASAQSVLAARAHFDRIGIIHDPFAAGMLSGASARFVRALRLPGLRRFARSPSLAYLAARTLFFDTHVEQAIEQGIGQIVILGAGYDARAWRFAHPGVTFFEVDHPATQAAKRRVAPPLTSEIDVRFVPVDLVDGDVGAALRSGGFDSEQRCHVLAEGLTMYLDADTVASVWRSLADVASDGSTISANFTGRGGGASSMMSTFIAAAIRLRWRQRGEPMHHWANHDAVRDLHASTDWRLDSIENGRDLATRLAESTRLPSAGVSDHVYNTTATRTDDPPSSS